MENPVIITICILLLFAYVFDISSKKTKIPSAILLLLTGGAVHQIITFLDITIPKLTSALPILGTLGLILIVLDGALELRITKSKLPLVGKSSLMALLPMLFFSFGLAYLFHHFGGVGMKIGLVNAIPFAIISSAIAIPSAHNLMSQNKEFVTYESSLSDIFGVILFNFCLYNEHLGFDSVGHFLLQVVIILVITFVATIGLAFLLSKIKQHVKFVPIILMIVLIYVIAKVFHLPALVYILLFGLFLGNLDSMQQLRFIQRLQPEILSKEVHRFKELIVEFTFLISAS